MNVWMYGYIDTWIYRYVGWGGEGKIYAGKIQIDGWRLIDIDIWTYIEKHRYGYR